MENDALLYIAKIMEVLPEDKDMAVTVLEMVDAYIRHLRRSEIVGFSCL
jgi:hypothetical protein